MPIWLRMQIFAPASFYNMAGNRCTGPASPAICRATQVRVCYSEYGMSAGAELPVSTSAGHLDCTTATNGTVSKQAENAQEPSQPRDDCRRRQHVFSIRAQDKFCASDIHSRSARYALGADAIRNDADNVKYLDKWHHIEFAHHEWESQAAVEFNQVVRYCGQDDCIIVDDVYHVCSFLIGLSIFFDHD